VSGSARGTGGLEEVELGAGAAGEQRDRDPHREKYSDAQDAPSRWDGLGATAIEKLTVVHLRDCEGGDKTIPVTARTRAARRKKRLKLRAIVRVPRLS